jgi:hypothetical protein
MVFTGDQLMERRSLQVEKMMLYGMVGGWWLVVVLVRMVWY